MSFLARPVEKDQCLFVIYRGKSLIDEMMSARSATNRYLVSRHWNKIIVDITALQPMPTTMEVINLASDLSSDLPPNTRIALVVNAEQAEHAKLAGRVAQIEGVRLNCFFDMREANAWVKGAGQETTGVSNGH